MKNYNDPEKALLSTFGYESFRPMQKKIIDAIMLGNDCFVVMPTGSGKSLCYQIPSICMDGLAVVISPLIALMKTQVNHLNINEISAASINHTCSAKEYNETIKKIISKKLDILYISPEKLMSNTMISLLLRIKISFFAVDESHCISEWGHDFRPEYLKISKLKSIFLKTPIACFTATADLATKQDIENKLNLKNQSNDVRYFFSSFKRENIFIELIKENSKLKQLELLCLSNLNKSTIVYASSRKKVDQTHQYLIDSGLKASKYHAGMPNIQREQEQNNFILNKTKIMIATIAFGMGIDKPDVRLVIHIDIPNSIESYYQEIGRAGRDGGSSKAILMIGYSDIAVRKKIISEHSTTKELEMRSLKKFSSMIDFAKSRECRSRSILKYFGEKCSYNYSCNNCDNCLTSKHSII